MILSVALKIRRCQKGLMIITSLQVSDRCAHDHPLGSAAENLLVDSSLAVTAHHDQVLLQLVGSFNDFRWRMSFFYYCRHGDSISGYALFSQFDNPLLSSLHTGDDIYHSDFGPRRPWISSHARLGAILLQSDPSNGTRTDLYKQVHSLHGLLLQFLYL